MAMDKATLVSALEAISAGDGSVDDFVDALEAFIQSATVTVQVTAADIGLQTSTAVGTPTAGPAVTKNLTGSIT